MPLRLEAAILSRTRSPISSRSNWAKDNSTLSVSRPMLELVLKDCVTDTNETAVLLEQLDQLGKIRQRAREPVDLVYHHGVDLAGPDIRQEPLQGRPFQGGPREGSIVIMVGDEPPAFGSLALDIGLTGLALGVERGEREIEVMLRRLAGVDGAAR